jgi:hypothetical protein
MLSGKGWFIWQIPRCERGSPAAIATKAVEAGATHVLLKVAERTYPFGFDKHGNDLVPAVTLALKQHGLQVWGWHYVYGDRPKDEARVAIRRTLQLQLDGYVIDAEIEYRQPGKAAAARAFMAALREGLPASTLVALSSYRFPSLHRQLPWRTFLEGCDYAMPQVYWEQAHNPEQQLARSVAEFSDPGVVGVVRPVVPTGAAYGTGSWRATAKDITKFLAKARALGLPAANLYSWDYAASQGNIELWAAAAEFDWAARLADLPDDDLAELYITALNSGDPRQVVALYHANAGYVTARHTLLGKEDLARWFAFLLYEELPAARFQLVSASSAGNTLHLRWTASSSRGQVCDGEDTLGLLNGRIQYHYSGYSLSLA